MKKTVLIVLVLFCFVVPLLAVTSISTNEVIDEWGDSTGKFSLKLETDVLTYTEWNSKSQTGKKVEMVYYPDQNKIIGYIFTYSSISFESLSGVLTIKYRDAEKNVTEISVSAPASGSSYSFEITGSKAEALISAMSKTSKTQVIISGSDIYGSFSYNFSFDYDQKVMEGKIAGLSSAQGGTYIGKYAIADDFYDLVFMLMGISDASLTSEDIALFEAMFGSDWKRDLLSIDVEFKEDGTMDMIVSSKLSGEYDKSTSNYYVDASGKVYDKDNGGYQGYFEQNYNVLHIGGSEIGFEMKFEKTY